MRNLRSIYIAYDDEGASLLINSNEQMFAEKLRSLLRFGALSSRYKDKSYTSRLRTKDANWLGVDSEVVTKGLIDFLKQL